MPPFVPFCELQDVDLAMDESAFNPQITMTFSFPNGSCSTFLRANAVFVTTTKKGKPVQITFKRASPFGFRSKRDEFLEWHGRTPPTSETAEVQAKWVRGVLMLSNCRDVLFHIPAYAVQ